MRFSQWVVQFAFRKMFLEPAFTKATTVSSSFPRHHLPGGNGEEAGPLAAAKVPPPFCLFNASLDMPGLTAQALEFMEALKEAGCPHVEHHTMKWTGHIGIVRSIREPSSKHLVIRQATRFLRHIVDCSVRGDEEKSPAASVSCDGLASAPVGVGKATSAAPPTAVHAPSSLAVPSSAPPHTVTELDMQQLFQMPDTLHRAVLFFRQHLQPVSDDGCGRVASTDGESKSSGDHTHDPIECDCEPGDDYGCHGWRRRFEGGKADTAWLCVARPDAVDALPAGGGWRRFGPATPAAVCVVQLRPKRVSSGDSAQCARCFHVWLAATNSSVRRRGLMRGVFAAVEAKASALSDGTPVFVTVSTYPSKFSHMYAFLSRSGFVAAEDQPQLAAGPGLHVDDVQLAMAPDLGGTNSNAASGKRRLVKAIRS